MNCEGLGSKCGIENAGLQRESQAYSDYKHSLTFRVRATSS